MQKLVDLTDCSTKVSIAHLSLGCGSCTRPVGVLTGSNSPSGMSALQIIYCSAECERFTSGSVLSGGVWAAVTTINANKVTIQSSKVAGDGDF